MRGPTTPAIEGTSSLRSLILPLYAPTFLIAIGMGAATPIFPLHAMDLGASVAMAGVFIALNGLGSLVVSVPGGLFCARFGEKRIIVFSAAGMLLAALAISLQKTSPPLAPLMLLMGASHGLWTLSRLAWARRAIPQLLRGRSLSVLGGVNRIGWFIGPVAGGLIGSAYGLELVFVAQAAITGAGLLISILAVRDFARLPPATGGGGLRLTGRILLRHRRVFLTAGTAMIFLGVVRSAFKLVIPLWGDHLGLDVAAIGLVVGLSAAVDMSLFVPAGLLMDKRGRKWSAVPCTLILAASVALVPVTGGFFALMLVALLGGVGNGLGSGINMTFGADLAPADAPGEFLGLWRAVSDVGFVLGPVVSGAAAAALTLPGAAVAAGTLGIVGGFVFIFLVPEPLRRARADSVRRDQRGSQSP